jgi:hypothetical protein
MDSILASTGPINHEDAAIALACIGRTPLTKLAQAKRLRDFEASVIESGLDPTSVAARADEIIRNIPVRSPPIPKKTVRIRSVFKNTRLGRNDAEMRLSRILSDPLSPKREEQLREFWDQVRLSGLDPQQVHADADRIYEAEARTRRRHPNRNTGGVEAKMEARVMDLKDFVKNSLIQIIEGVKAADAECAALGARIAPKVTSSRDRRSMDIKTGEDVHVVSFDVAVVATEEKSSTGGGGLKIAVISAGADLKNANTRSTESHIQFEVPVTYPDTTGRYS